MRLQIYYDKDNIIRIVSKKQLISRQYKSASADFSDDMDYNSLIGKKIHFKKDISKKLKVALICNWDDQCGISTYTKFLVDSLKPKLSELKIFSEYKQEKSCVVDSAEYDVTYCWKRGTSMLPTIQMVMAEKPDLVLIQHEFGLFPNANYFLPMMEALSEVPTVVTLHSVYEHRDKSICTSSIKNIVVHSKSAEKCLRDLGHKSQDIKVIPHGCIDLGIVKENWPFAGPHSIMQFGFGFSYKGVEIALESINSLKKKYPKIFYTYFCSQNEHTKNIHDIYYNTIKNKIRDLNLENNANIQRGFFTEEELNQHLRTCRLAIFPYVTDPKNIVRGASGAARISMANNTPTIVSNSFMFDDLDGVLPRPNGPVALSYEIDKVFSNKKYKEELLKKSRDYILSNTWEITADRYIEFFKQCVDKRNEDVIMINIEQ